MPRKQTPTLTEAELRIMNVVWELDGASVNDVLTALPQGEQPAYNTILTTMRILERKGYLKHVKDGRAFVYRPLVDRRLAQKRAVRQILRTFFDGSREELMVSVLKDESLTPSELSRLKQMINERK